MADAEHQASVTVVQVDDPLAGHMLAVSSCSVAADDEGCGDILQQALVEANECFDENTVVYTTGDCVATIADGSGVQIPLTMTVTDTDNVVNNVQSLVNGATYAYVSEVALSDGTQTIAIPSQDQVMLSLSGMTAPVPDGTTQHFELGDIVQPCNDVNGIVPDDEESQGTTSATTFVESQVSNIVGNEGGNLQSILPSNSTGTMTVITNGAQSSTPELGSSQNPIRIVQQGSQYTSVQQLNAQQLQQIMQVVQDQHVAKTAQIDGSSVMFNPETQTRIVYRVIYPSELHANTSGSMTNLHGTPLQVSVPTDSVMIQQLKRPYRKRKNEDDGDGDDDKIDVPDLSKEEKEARKKHRPRTRSGRVSRPPKHMVQDYKHIHPVDWDEDYDDSDGGYSDFRQSDEDADKADSPYPNYTSMTSGKPKNWKCDKCPKAYIGRAGLARHFRMRPSHGSLLHDPSAGDDAEDSSRDSREAVSLDDTIASTQLLPVATEDVTAPSVPTTTATVNVPADVTAIPGGETTTSTTTLQPKPVFRGRPPADTVPVKRKARLKELVKHCTDEELMELVLPRLASAITLWEFLMMKVERGQPPKPHIVDMYHEYDALHKQMTRMCDAQLRPAATSSDVTPDHVASNQLQVTDEVVAQSLGLTVGVYDVLNTPAKSEPKFQYNFLTVDPASALANNSQVAKRTVQLVEPYELVSNESADSHPPPYKAVKFEEDVLSPPLPAVTVNEPSHVVYLVNTAVDRTNDEVQETNSMAQDDTQTVQDINVQVTDPNELEEPPPASTEHVNLISAPDFGSQNILCVQADGSQTVMLPEHQQLTESMQLDETGADLLVAPTENSETTQVYIEAGEMAGELPEDAQIFQTEDGLIVIQSPDGTIQIHSQNGQQIPLETVQALLGMDADATQLETMEPSQ